MNTIVYIGSLFGLYLELCEEVSIFVVKYESGWRGILDNYMKDAYGLDSDIDNIHKFHITDNEKFTIFMLKHPKYITKVE